MSDPDLDAANALLYRATEPIPALARKYGVDAEPAETLLALLRNRTATEDERTDAGFRCYESIILPLILLGVLRP